MRRVNNCLQIVVRCKYCCAHACSITVFGQCAHKNGACFSEFFEESLANCLQRKNSENKNVNYDKTIIEPGCHKL